VVDGEASEPVNLTSGVPQGTVTSPLLFLIFVNDIPDAVDSMLKIFVDDTKLYRKIVDGDDVLQLQIDLDTIAEWAKTWKMVFN
jgi:hypothetical protein